MLQCCARLFVLQFDLETIHWINVTNGISRFLESIW